MPHGTGTELPPVDDVVMRFPRAFALLPLLLIACSGDPGGTQNSTVDTTRMSGGPGLVILVDSLTVVDGNQLPCCTVDSAGVSRKVVAGRLTFFAAAQYTDMMSTPEGDRPSPCVQRVPNGSHIGGNNLLTLTDGTSHLLLRCTAGYYAVTLTEQLQSPCGSTTNRDVTLSSGAYNWQRDKLAFAEQSVVAHVTTSMSGATITVNVPVHRYQFLALPRP